MSAICLEDRYMRDSTTTIAELQQLVMAFLKARHWNPTPKKSRNLAISIALEAAELLEHFQWEGSKYEAKKRDASEIKKELADVLIYCLEFAAANKIDIAEAIEEKMAHNAKKYPAHLFRKNRNNAANYYRIKEAASKKKT